MKRYLLYLVFTVVLATAGCTRGQWLDEVVADRQYQANAVEELKEAKATNLYVLYVNKDKDENYTIHFSNNTSTSFNIINKEEDGHKYPNMLFVTSIVDTPTKVTITIDGNGEQALTSESELTFYVIGRDGTGIPVNEIRYTTTDGTPISPQSVCFGTSDVVITSNVYKNSGGVITCGGDITLVDNSAFKGCGNLETISFPESLTTIGNSAFAECKSLKTVNLPENLTTIGDEVFLNCEALESIDLPSNITSIGFLAFAGCSSLREIVIPEGITTIVNNLFENCGNLVSVTLPEKVTTIGTSAFAGCASLTNIPIPESVIAFEDNAFSGCASLASINIPDLLHSIGKSAFNGCASLTKITLPTYNLTKLGEYAFYGCSKLTSINLPVVIDNIADFLLAGCSSLTNIEIPTLITSIGEGAFNGCLALEEINIPEKVTTIGASAFAGCSKLTIVTIPSGVTSIGRSAFYNCSNLAGVYCKPTTPPAGGNSMFHSNASGRKIYVPEKNIEAYKSAEWWNNYTDDFVAYDFVKGEEAIPDNFKIFYTTTDGKVLTPNVLDGFGANIRFNTYEDGRGAIVFDGEVTHIPAEAFQSSQTLATITIPEGVTTVEEGAFAHCLNLSKFEGKFASTDGRSLIQEGTLVAFAPFGTTKYTIPTSVTAIGGSAFAGFDNLTSITISEGVTSIGDYAFEGCVGFITITIPESVTTIGCGALSGCSSLATVYCKPTTPPAAKVLGNYYPTPSWNAFEGSSLTLVIYVPYVSVEAYKSASGWSTYADAFVAYDFENGEVFVNEKMKIYYTSTDGNVVTPSFFAFGVNIVSNTYENGQGVITFDGDVTKIGTDAYYDRTTLASITIPEGVTEIGYRAFSGCSGLASITIPESVTSIDTFAFSGCTSLASATIGKGVTSIGDSAFSGCSSLASITIPDGVTSIGESAFEGCSSLTSITIPEGVTEIESSTFSGCSSLVSITVPKSVTSIGQSAFYNCSSLKEVHISDVAAWCKITFQINESNEFNSDINPLYYANNLYLNGELVSDLVIPEGVTSIASYAFNSCKCLMSVTIPESVTSIGCYVFENCSSLSRVYCKPTTPPNPEWQVAETYWHTFSGNASGRSIYVPAESLEAYKSTYGWNDYVYSLVPYDFENDEIVVDDNRKIYYTSTDGNIVRPYKEGSSVFGANIISNTYRNGRGVITFDGVVTMVGQQAFYGCSTLTSVAISDDVTSIGDNAFYGCNNLANIDISENLTSIGISAFSGCSSLTSITLPQSITSIGENAFYDCVSIAKVYASDLTAWCKIVFKDYYSNPTYYSKNLYLNGELVTNVIIPEDVTRVGKYAFYRCSSIKSVTIHDGVTHIGLDAFGGCSNLDVYITDMVTWFDAGFGESPIQELYLNGELVTEVVVPEEVEYIGSYAFFGCASITNVIIHDNVTSIGERAFQSCQNLKSVTIGNNVSSIYAEAFSHCSSLATVYCKPTTPPRAEELWMGGAPYWDAFAGTAEDLIIYIPVGSENAYYDEHWWSDWANVFVLYDFEKNEVYVPNTHKIYYTSTDGNVVTPFRSGTSYFGANIISNTYADGQGVITFDGEVTKIGSDAFHDCATLASITIPDSVTSIEGSAFLECTSLAEFRGKFASEDGCCLIVDDVFKHFAPKSELTEYTIPDSVTSIGDWAFYKCSSLTSITIPDSVISIGSSAFSACSSLASITIPEGVTEIGFSSFSYCSKLTSITIPNSVTSIGGQAFYGCSSLVSITIPDGVTSIGNAAFRYCSKLAEVYCKSAMPPTAVPSYDSTYWDAFDDNTSGRKIYVPEESVEAYKTAEWWSEYADAFEPYDFEKGEVVNPENRKIYYTSTSGNVVTPNKTNVFGANIVSNTYENGQGVITFDGNVTKIGDSAFRDCSSLTSITIPDGVTSIGDLAFYGCSSLTSITIPEGVTSIGYGAFYGCSAIESITIPESVTEIGNFAFYNCSSLTSITISEGVTSIGNAAFASCTSLASVTIGNGVTSIGNEAFYNCSSLASISIPENVTSIGTSAFYNCSSLASITIPEGVTSIGDNAFWSCSSLAEFSGKFASEDGRCLIVNGKLNSFAPAGLTEYTIPEGVTEIGDFAFAYCSSLASITIPDSVTSIGSYAFYGCSSLASITIPDSVTSIGDNAFRGCSSLASITIPDSVTSIGYAAFRYCSKLAEVYCKSAMPPTAVPSTSSSPYWDAFDSNASDRKIYVPEESVEAYKTAEWWSEYADAFVPYDFEKGEVVNQENRKIYYTSTDGNVVTPNSTSAFGANIVSNTYENGQGVITFDGNVTKIGDFAFSYCSSLASVTIPDSVTSIGIGAFESCSSLASITIPDSVTSIGSSAFHSCSSLASITIPEGVTSIEDYAFYDCSNLASVTIPESVTSIGYGAFYGCSSLTSITIPDSVTSIGSQAFRDCSSLVSITIPEGVTSIEDYAFYDCSNLASVTIPNGITSIGKEAFYGCSSLANITIPTGVTSIGNKAFYNCSSLASITIPDSVNSIGDYAFYYCTSLASITILEGVTSIGESAFYKCTSLTSITIPDSVTSIGNSVFTGCSSLTSITIPDSVTSIGNSVFSGCSGLTSTTIPEGVTSIGERAFYNCSRLASITIPDSVTSIGYSAFWGCSRLASVYCKAITPPTAIPNSSSSWGAFYSNASGRKIYVPEESVEAYKTAEGWSEYSDAFVAYDFEKGEVVNLESRKIYYTSTDGNVVTPYATNVFGANIVSNTYADGQGVITFDGNVTKIESQAFNNCATLATITLPESVTSIGYYAFGRCSNLASILIPERVTKIGIGAFQECSSLSSIIIPESVTSIGSSAFCACSKLAEFSGKFASGDGRCLIIDGVLNTFASAGLTEYTIPEGVTSIGDSAFRSCSSLASITIPEGVTEIGLSSFSGCSKLTSVTISNSVTSIGGQAFYGCSGLASITIPESVTSIGFYAFRYCRSLKEVYCKATTPPTAVPSYNSTYWRAFDDNASDRKIYVPEESVEAYKTAEWWSNYADAFVPYDFEKGEEVEVEVPETWKIYYTSTDGGIVTPYSTYAFGANIVSNTYENGQGVITFDGEVTQFGERVFISCSSLASVTIPDSVTSIGGYAFYGCKSLTSITIPESVTSIGDEAFYACSSLANITIPTGVTSIGKKAFYNCSSLASVTIPDSVTSIGGYAFYGCKSLTSITIPDSVTSIGYYAFYDCSSLASVYCKAITPPTAILDALSRWNAFNSNASGRKIYVPEESVEAYKTAEWWSAYADAFVPYDFEMGEVVVNEKMKIYYTSTDGNVVTPYATNVFGANIVSNTYADGQGVITFDGNVTKIGDQAFYNCSSLTSITIPEGVTEIGNYAFSYCSSLASINIPDSVTSIGNGAFYNCSGLASITIPDSVTSIGTQAFYNCSSLTSINIPDSVTSIGTSAFYNCSSLASITIPESVTSIGEYAFCECSSLAEFCGKFASEDGRCLIVDGVINSFAIGCGLTEYVIPNGVTTIGRRAFYECDELVSVTIPDGVTSIDEDAFRGCDNLASINIPEGVTEIGDYAFGSAELTSVTLPESLTSLGWIAFAYCYSLAEVYCKAITPPTAIVPKVPNSSYEWDAFDYNTSGRKIYVPEESVEAYKTAEGWSKYADAIEPYVFE